MTTQKKETARRSEGMEAAAHTPGMDFGEALKELRAGRRMRSLSCHHAGYWLALVHEVNAIGEFFAASRGGTLWEPTQREILATDWVRS